MMLRNLCAVALTAAALASPAAAEGAQERFEGAGKAVAIANGCRIAFGDEQLFETAFEIFSDASREVDDGPSRRELKAAKRSLLSQDETALDRTILKDLCSWMRQELLPE